MSLIDSASLILTPNAYKEGKLYSVIPSDGSGDMSVVRATSATRVNAEGLIETASVLGSELVTNGDFATDSNWYKGTGWSISNGTLQGTNVNAISATQGGFSFLNKSFKVEYTITEISQGGIKVFLGGSQSTPQRSAAGTYVEYIDITSGNSTLYIYGINFTGKIDNVSVKEVITLNIPRIDYSLGGCPNILLEPQRTNLSLQSSSFDSATWLKVNASVTANSTTSPSGITDADTLTADGTSNIHQTVSSAISFTNSTTYTYSVYVKKNTNNFIQLYFSASIGGMFANFDLNNGVVGTLGTITGTTPTSSITSVGNGWYRCSMTITANATTTAACVIHITSSSTAPRAESNTLSTSVFLWGAQAEAGAYATSYIPTTTASVTRNADVCLKTGISSLIGQTEGTLYWEGENIGDNFAPYLGLFADAPYTNNTRVMIYYISKTSLQVQIRVNSVQQFLSAAASVSGKAKVAIGYKQNDFVLYVDGVKISESSSGSTFTNELTTFSFNSAICKSDKILLFKTRLSNAELATLTTL